MPRKSKNPKVEWAEGFKLPTASDELQARGSFPWTTVDPKWRHDALASASLHGNQHEEQLNVADLYRSKGVSKLKCPQDDQDWLASYVEEGQTFDDYVRDTTLRSGRFTSHASMSRTGGILLVPIIKVTNRETPESWPAVAPDLEELRRFTFAFFGESTPVVVSNPAHLLVHPNKDDKVEWIPPEGCSGPARWANVRKSSEAEFGRMQVHIESILTCLCDLTSGFGLTDGPPHSVVGVTFEDTFSCDADLFIAGFAAGGSHVAAFSLLRYHPQIKMSPVHWWKYGFTGAYDKKDNYSYFEESDNVQFLSPNESEAVTNPGGGDGKRRATGRKRKGVLTLTIDIPTTQTPDMQHEALRRASKLVVHEIGHLYIIGHCIFKSCLMNGSGHLVEDYAAPSHLCGIDLRKLQYRLGFDVPARYGALAEIWQDWGFNSEAAWCRRRQVEASECILQTQN